MYSYIVEEAQFLQFIIFTKVLYLNEKVDTLFCLNIGITGKIKSIFGQFP